MSPGRAILLILTIVAFLFLIIEFVALVMGLALARSITSSIHELFMGTERVRHGDFTHRINIMGNDQLGELAGSFNQMIGASRICSRPRPTRSGSKRNCASPARSRCRCREGRSTCRARRLGAVCPRVKWAATTTTSSSCQGTCSAC